MVLQKKKYRERLDYMKENEDAAVKVCSYHREWQNYYSARKSFWFISLYNNFIHNLNF